jgi:aerobic-type carbon monoxide dehydrogenase small subunit (CoxS/CutS family)
VVHIGGRAAKSCTVLAGQAAGSSVTTIESIAHGDEPHPSDIHAAADYRALIKVMAQRAVEAAA